MNSIAILIKKHYKKILLLSFVLGIIAVFLVSKLTVSSSFEDVLPNDSQVLKAEKAFQQYFESQDQGVVVLEGPSSEVMPILSTLATKLEELSSVKEVYYKITFDELGPKALLYGDYSETGMYFTNEAQDVFLMFVKPNMSSDNFIKDREVFYKDVTKEINKITTINVGLTGGAFIQDYEADTVAFEGMGLKVFFTLILIILFVMSVFRRILVPMMTLYPLILGALFAGAFAYVVYGSLNMFSVSFAMLLLGLGIDFGIHLLTRILEEDKALDIAIEQSLKTTGKSIIIGAITTSFAFLAFIIAKFSAFEQMGIISGVGVMILAVTMIFVFPSMMMLFKNKKTRIMPPSKWIQKVVHINLSLKPVIVLGLVITVVTLFSQVTEMTVVGDLNKIYPENMPSKTYETILEEAVDYDVDTLSIMIDQEGAQETILKLDALASVQTVSSIYDFMPPNQMATIDVLKLQGVSLEAITVNELPKQIREKYLSEHKMLVEIAPSFNVYDIDKFNALVEELLEITENRPVGIASMMNEIIQITKKDILKISILCVVMIFILIFLMFKSIKKTLVTIMPVLLTVYTCIGILPLIGKDINIFSIAAFPLILGIGIDGSIHLMHRIESTQKISEISNTIQAIFITSVTTMIGFGSLGFINHPGMANLGITVALGMIINFVFTILVIPSIMLKKPMLGN